MSGSLLKRIKAFKTFYLMFLPVALYFIVFTYYPFFLGLVMSFQENRLIGARPFVGLENYRFIVKDSNFIAAIGNSLIIGLWDMVLYFLCSLALALVLNEVRHRTLKQSIQTIAYIPYLFSWSVIGGVWALIFDLQGLVNKVIGLFGVEPIFFLATPDYARPLIIAMGVWRSMGYFALLFTVSIMSIDQQLFEAARIDGASRMEQIRRIILPGLIPTMKTIIVLLSIGVLTHFDEIYVMVNPANRRLISTLLLYVYETGILNFKTGTASAGAMLVMIGTLVVTISMRRVIGYDKDE
ncbi:MAG TPA: ABC transporter permease subunit [Sphaerochaeta sp.]|jgi:putative aldouronate transport system permease protein|nr:ABC transporter permease subunit [Spirochaetota bacterium]NLL25249.1 sugar ABC transporter permease [Spirochaetales bacterium]TAH56405.1 MAG: sugar ABC transporter permease [Sphaerochaeta sp.]HOE89705.1 ABC transporter permease subunit [Sphaerochaeta sp.]HOR80788.1 ABC transporter permease subunit [Sphaerochaeta sp.]